MNKPVQKHTQWGTIEAVEWCSHCGWTEPRIPGSDFVEDPRIDELEENGERGCPHCVIGYFEPLIVDAWIEIVFNKYRRDEED